MTVPMWITSKDVKECLERMGFGVAHARRSPRSQLIRVYIAVHHDKHPDVDELWWSPSWPDTVLAINHATKPNGSSLRQQQYDKPLYRIDLLTGETFRSGKGAYRK